MLKLEEYFDTNEDYEEEEKIRESNKDFKEVQDFMVEKIRKSW